MEKTRKRSAQSQQSSSGSKPKKLKQSSSTSDISSSTSADAKTSSNAHIDQPRRVKPHIFLRKPQKSYLSHLGSIVACRCVSRALSQGIDPRSQLFTFEDDLEEGDYLSSEDVKMMWYFIMKEYPDKTLEEIHEALKPYFRLSVDPLVKEDIKTKYKQEMPKAPVTAYMLFSKSKGPKLKEKHPDLTITDMAKKLGKKWRTLSSERQEKYKQQYALLKKSYESQMTQFYTDHPDAKLSEQRSRKRIRSRKLNGRATVKVVPSPEDVKFKELVARMPKPPTTSYFLYCKEKREKLQKKHPELSSQEVTRRLSKNWNSLGVTKKEKYTKMYQEAAKEYNRKLEEFHKQNTDAKQFIARYKQSRAQTSTKRSPSSKASLASGPRAVEKEIASNSKDKSQEGNESEADEEIDVGTPADCVNVDGTVPRQVHVEIESPEEHQESDDSESEDSESESETE